MALAYHRGKPVVGAAVLLAGDTAQYLFGGSDDAMLKLNAGYALQWWLIELSGSTATNGMTLAAKASAKGCASSSAGWSARKGRVVEANVDFEHSGSRSGRMVAEIIFGARAAKRFYMKLLNA